MADPDMGGEYDVCDQELGGEGEEESEQKKPAALRPSLEKFSHAVDGGLEQVKPVMETIEKIVLTK